MAGADELGQLLQALKAASPDSRILILDLPSDAVLRQVQCKRADPDSVKVHLTLTIESLDSIALQEIAKRLAASAAASEAALAARKAEKAEE